MLANGSRLSVECCWLRSVNETKCHILDLPRLEQANQPLETMDHQ